MAEWRRFLSYSTLDFVIKYMINKFTNYNKNNGYDYKN